MLHLLNQPSVSLLQIGDLLANTRVYCHILYIIMLLTLKKIQGLCLLSLIIFLGFLLPYSHQMSEPHQTLAYCLLHSDTNERNSDNHKKVVFRIPY